MNAPRSLLHLFAAGSFALFLFGSTFSIAFSQIMLGISLALFAMLVIKERIDPFPQELRGFYYAIVLFVGWEVFTSFFTDNPFHSLELLREEWLFLVIPLGVCLLREERTRQWTLRAFAVGAFLVSCYGIYQLFTGHDLIRDKMLLPAKDFGYLISGAFNIRITFGNYYAVAGVFLTGIAVTSAYLEITKRRWLVIAVGAFALLMAFLSFTRGSMVAAVVGLLTLGLLLGKRHALRTVIILAVALAAVVAVKPGLIKRFTNTSIEESSSANLMSRSVIWEHTLEIIKAHPLVGLGAGNFRYEYERHLPADAPAKAKHSHAHNDLLNEAVVSGIPGALLFLTIWILLIRHLLKARRQSPFALAALAASVTFFVASMTESTFVDEEVRQLLMAVWAFGLFSVPSGETRHVLEGKKP